MSVTYNLRSRSITTASGNPSDSTKSTALPGTVTDILSVVGDVTVPVLRQLTYDLVQRQRTPDLKLQCIKDILELGSRQAEYYSAIIVEAWSILNQDAEIWRCGFASKDEALRVLDTQQLQDIRRLFNRGVSRKDTAIKKIRSHWPEVCDRLSLADQGEHYLEYLARIAERHTPGVALELGVRTAIRRLREDRAGRGGTRAVTCGDWVEVCGLSAATKAALCSEPPLSDSERSKYSIHDNSQLLSTLSINAIAIPSAREAKSKRRKWRSQNIAKSKTHKNAAEDQDVAINAGTVADTAGAGADDGDTPMVEETDNGDSAMHDGTDDEDAVTDDVREREKKNVPSPATLDTCTCRGIPQAVRDRIARSNRHNAGLKTDSERIAMIESLKDMQPDGNMDLTHLCYRHLRALAAHCGLQTKMINHRQLHERVAQLSQMSLTALRVGDETSAWFRKKDRPSIEADALGIYAFPSPTMPALQPISEDVAQRLLVEVTGRADAWQAWTRDGNLHVDLFSWLWTGLGGEPGIGPMIDADFEMYLHHQREINGKPNRGWLRTMLYSLTQQIIRGDLLYWLLYVALRPDRNPRLISYPYYAKFATGGDSTTFRHIDINIPQFLETGRGGDMIQGSVSLDDETAAGGCTEIVPGFHHHLRAWWEDVVARSPADQNLRASGFVKDVAQIYTKADATRWGEYTPVPCRQGEVRITKPEIIHGSTATAENSGRRRTILPWFVGVRDDRSTLDCAEAESWGDLCVAHTAQTSPKLTPSGHPNMYGRIPYKFPAGVRLCLASPVSQALTCQRSWWDPDVVAQAKILLGPDRIQAQRIVSEGRLMALLAFKAAYRTQVMTEKASFGENSYFLGVGANRERPVVDGVAGQGNVDMEAEDAALANVL